MLQSADGRGCILLSLCREEMMLSLLSLSEEAVLAGEVPSKPAQAFFVAFCLVDIILVFLEL